MAENDGTFRCKPCRQALNETDANCWRCGSKDIEDLRPKDDTITLDLVDLIGTEEVLRQWATQTYNTWTAATPSTWTVKTLERSPLTGAWHEVTRTYGAASS